MAKRKRRSKESASEKSSRPVDHDVIDGEVVDDAKTENNSPKDFFSKLSEGFKAAGETTARYTRVGISMAELEKLRLELRLAYTRLGESVTRCWDAAPDIGVGPTDASVKDPLKKVNE